MSAAAYIVLQGTLKKLKTNKRRYFVLFRESPDQQSRLDYYENEKKFRHKYAVPKRSIVLKSCFHIDQRRDTKHKYVISLYTKDDCFGLVMDSEADMLRWMQAMRELHSDQFKGDKTRPSFGEFEFGDRGRTHESSRYDFAMFPRIQYSLLDFS